MKVTYTSPSEMSDEERRLAASAEAASREAVQRTFAAGLPITILRGRRIVRVWADGREELVKELAPRG